MASKMRMGDLLVEGRLITEEQLKYALEIQKKSGDMLGHILVDLGIVTEDQVLSIMKKKLNIPFVKLENLRVTERLLEFLPEEIARTKQMFPYKIQDNILYVATSDPLDYGTFNEISLANGKHVEPVLATAGEINAAINKYYSKQSINRMASALDFSIEESAHNDDSFQNFNFDEMETRIENTSIVKIINNLIYQAYLKRASDIHIEPLSDTVRVRFRIDGELIEIVRFSLKAHSSIITRLKVMAGMDIAEKRIPLDGRFSTTINFNQISIRAASMPTIYGEKMVLRLMADESSGIISLEDLGILDEHINAIRTATASPNGLILVTGPTGSGKSTTLYSILHEISDVRSNVITVEDPVEKTVPGVNQTQVNVKAGLTFASGLRAILRQDPDKIMIGEIRDIETVDIATRAAITGHLVLASMHTNSAAATYMRMIDMGVEPFIVASSVICVISQRLIRVICPYCKEPYIPTEVDKRILRKLHIPQDVPLFKGKGCDRCDYSGNYGRTSVMEIILTDGAIRDFIMQKAKESDIEEYLTKEKNQIYMVEQALKLVLDGKVFIKELVALMQLS
ncbi:MAG: ATPase, T2SS/T4P/T4SS family [Clostridiales bacterium]